ncbi:MAG: hypothetical protein ACPIOQ_26050, partial [Promethearchaeia archaeon]
MHRARAAVTASTTKWIPPRLHDRASSPLASGQGFNRELDLCEKASGQHVRANTDCTNKGARGGLVVVLFAHGPQESPGHSGRYNTRLGVVSPGDARPHETVRQCLVQGAPFEQ